MCTEKKNIVGRLTCIARELIPLRTFQPTRVRPN